MYNTGLIFLCNLLSFLKRKEEILGIILTAKFPSDQISSPIELSVFLPFFNFILVKHLLLKYKLRVFKFVRYKPRRCVYNCRPRNNYSYLYVDSFMICLCTKSQMSGPNSSLDITIKGEN